MADLKNIIYISNEDFETLVSTGSVTIGGETLTYDPNNVYITPDELATTTSDGLMSSSDKTKLDSVQSGAEANVQSDWNVSDSSSDAFIKNKPTIPSMTNVAYKNVDNNFSVAQTLSVSGTITSGNTSAVTGGAVYSALPTESTVSGWGFTKNEGTVKSVNSTSPDANGNVSLTIPSAVTSVNGLSGGTISSTTTINGDMIASYVKIASIGHETTSSYNKHLTLSSTNYVRYRTTSELKSDLGIPSGTIATTSDLASKQDTLVSGTNIKTINGNSVLGSGDLVISGGGGDATWDFHAGTSWADCYSVASPNANDVNGYSIQIGGDGFTVDTGDINDSQWGGNNVFHAKNGYMGCAYDGWYFFSVNHNGSISVGDDSEGTSIFSAGNGWLYMYDGNEGVRGLDISVNSCSWYGYDIITAHNINGGGLTYDSTNKLLKHTNSVTAGTIGSSSASSGATLSVPYATYDANGHIKTKGTHTHTINAIKSYASRGSTGGTNRLDYDGLHIFIPYGEGVAQTSGRIGASSSSYTTFYGIAYGYLSVGSTATSTTYLYFVYRSSATGGWTTKTISWTGFSAYLMNVQVIRIVA